MNPTTATTSLDQVSALHKFVSTLGLSVFDYGAGKKGKIDDFYHNLRLEYLPVDPFHRQPSENEKSWDRLERYGVDIVTCSNVLNVLDDSALNTCINNLGYATRETNKGLCFISVYHAPRFPRNMPRKGYIQRNWPIREYIPFLEKEFDKIWNLSKFLVCQTTNR